MNLSRKNRKIGVLARLGLATGVLLWLYPYPATAQVSRRPHPPENLRAQVLSETNQLFVNPNNGIDATGRGTSGAPFKTITQALRVARPNTVIVLAPGTYSTQTGESFPLELGAGIKIQGNPETRGQGIVIQGGGQFVSRSVAVQNVTLIAAEGSTLTGTTITNPNRRGYGLWIESTNPVVIENTFTGSTQDGIFVTGTGMPVIQRNNFLQNGANGITIHGRSKPELRENVFERTGFGINIVEESAPILIENRIRFNKDGIVVQASARPVLRNNQIEGNERDGLVAISNAVPNLGTANEPGGNVFRNNGQYDLNGEAAKQIIPAFGNQLSSNRTAGRIDLAGTLKIADTGTPVADSPQPSRPPATRPTPAPSSGANSFPRPTGSQTPPTASEPIPVPSPDTPIEIPVPRPQSSAAPSAPTPTPPPSTAGVATSSRSGNRGDTLPVLLPVPDPNAPLGNTGGGSQVTASNTSQSNSGSPPPPPSRVQALNLRYRVTVDAPGSREQARVRSLVPEAFRTILNGKVVMQVGVFSDRENAHQIAEMLNRNGLKATIHELQ